MLQSKNCEQCGNPLSPRRKRFCCNKCKDRYHNIHNPRGYYALGSEHNKEQVLRYPQTIQEMVNFKSFMADQRAGEEDCGDHPRY